jgi:hypothetical protein
MENENDSFLSKFEWNNFNITALNILLSELSQNGEVFLVGIFDNQMRPIRNVSFANTFRVNDMGLKVVPTKTKEMQMIGIDVFDNSNNNYTIFLGTKTNIDALRSVYSKIVPPFSEGGGVGSEITLTTEQVENKLGRELHWWKDDVVTINGTEYKKIFLKPEYKRLYALGGKVNEENEDLDLSKDFAIRNLFYKYEKQYQDEYNEDNWIKSSLKIHSLYLL